ncbi:ABC transporter ATP-binding protein [Vibrio sp. SS-MA-C1-2]|uniref:ABC transporter ATP-binding protein n=1 Tax=Vibrio sp. SS-MA-C1-2 TaxID=2908646 RepID=UPI001F310746|nr:ABC transporter ATP-binding protein [Vibrio sp. SS-MA-C1-2]UJF19757.1 ABC transporter ATP-binding protein [Vibrio sp. SS-MA-C1-2]
MTDLPLLEIKEVTTSFATDNGVVNVLDGVSFSLKAGKTLGIVGESGCGKSVTAMSIMRLLPQPAGRVESGEILFHQQDMLKLSLKDLYQLRGNRIAMIFQDPMTALNPVQTIRQQLFEVYQLHQPKLSKQAREQQAVEILTKVGIPSPQARLSEYPHQLSGGMRQRVMIAIALACKPDILIADEPTTALDVTIQAQILELMRQLQQETGMAIIFITHDLGVIAEMCDDVVVMYAGKVVEKADVVTLFDSPLHPYTQGLHASIPKLTTIEKSQLNTIQGTVPSLDQMPKGCRFSNRCQKVSEQCKQQPITESYAAQHQVACWHIH